MLEFLVCVLLLSAFVQEIRVRLSMLVALPLDEQLLRLASYTAIK